MCIILLVLTGQNDEDSVGITDEENACIFSRQSKCDSCRQQWHVAIELHSYKIPRLLAVSAS